MINLYICKRYQTSFLWRCICHTIFWKLLSKVQLFLLFALWYKFQYFLTLYKLFVYWKILSFIKSKKKNYITNCDTRDKYSARLLFGFVLFVKHDMIIWWSDKSCFIKYMYIRIYLLQCPCKFEMNFKLLSEILFRLCVFSLTQSICE